MYMHTFYRSLSFVCEHNLGRGSRLERTDGRNHEEKIAEQ
jgi:hypothetical protein